MIKQWHKGIAMGLLALSTLHVQAQDYPGRQPLKLVIGYPPGGPSDLIGRVMADQLAKELKQAVVVENRGGAGGMLGASHVASQKPDGYTLLLDGESISTRAPAIYKKLSYDPLKDFTRIARFATQRTLLVVHPSVEAKTVPELIKLAKNNPGKLNYGCSYGSASHLGAVQFNHLTGTDMTAVNYRGGGQLVTDFIAGIVQVAFYSESMVIPYVKSGQLRVLAVMGNERSTLLPDIPTITEAGGPAIDLSFWTGLVAPPGTPKPIVEKLAEATRKVASEPAFAKLLQAQGATPIKDSTPETYIRQTVDEIRYWSKMVTDGGVPKME